MQAIDQIGVTARTFVAARQQARAVAAYPGQPPQSLAAAYAIQEQAIALRGATIGGWKVGRIWPLQEQLYGANRLAGPIFADQIGNGRAPAGQVFAEGFGAAEAEFLVRLGDTVPQDAGDLPLERVADLIAAVHVGIEIASSPYPGINHDGPAVTISDFGNNNGLIVGSAIADWAASGFADWPVSVSVDGTIVGTGVAADFPDGPIGAVRFLLANLRARGIAITPGLWISTGAITGVHPVSPGQHVMARFGKHHEVTCEITAAQPEAAGRHDT